MVPNFTSPLSASCVPYSFSTTINVLDFWNIYIYICRSCRFSFSVQYSKKPRGPLPSAGHLLVSACPACTHQLEPRSHCSCLLSYIATSWTPRVPPAFPSDIPASWVPESFHSFTDHFFFQTVFDNTYILFKHASNVQTFVVPNMYSLICSKPD